MSLRMARLGASLAFSMWVAHVGIAQQTTNSAQLLHRSRNDLPADNLDIDELSSVTGEAAESNGASIGILVTASAAEPLDGHFIPRYQGSPCQTCPSCDACSGSYDLDAICQDCPTHGLYIFEGYDAWRGHPDGDWGNWGISSGANFGTRLGAFSDLTGIGFQIGGSAGAYNWAGTDYRFKNNDQAQPQGFVTYGFFRKANDRSPWIAAVVQDWMLNANYGVFAQNPTLSQWRVQLGYATSAWNEIGVWGAWRFQDDSRNVQGFGNIQWRSIDQLNGYWHYKWAENGVDTWLWVGVPERNRLSGNGSLGDYTVGALANAPLNDRFSVYSMVAYMHQSGRAGPIASTEDAWNFTVGIAFYFDYAARSRTVAGRCWMPQLPVANNGVFLVDTNSVY
ncbi:MAG: hypothetical protein IT427_06610 [Pirellulales bacterium]|nr:hypothetical protein [Pirellulales bacterium]